MREVIRAALVQVLGLPDDRVLEVHAATPETPKPFVIVRTVDQTAGEPWADHSTVVEVWPHVAQTSYVELDALAEQVVEALHRRRIAAGDDQYLVEFEAALSDALDSDWQAITKGLRFRVWHLGWLHGLTYEPDPVAAMEQWTAATWPGEVHTDPATWTPDVDRPGVYWRLAQPATAAEPTNWGAWMDAVLACHIVSPSPRTRLEWTRRVAEALALGPRVYMSDGSPLRLLAVRADSEANPMTQGQLRLTVRLGVLKSQSMALQIRRATLQGPFTLVVEV